MSHDRRHPSRPVGVRGRRALVASAAAAAVVLGGGFAVASAVESQPADPSVTDVTLDPPTSETAEPDSTTTVASVDDTAMDDTTTTTVVDGVEAADEVAEDGAGEHPDNHGKVVSEAAKDHSQDEAYGNHGQHVSGVARGEIDPSTDATEPPEGADSSTRGKGRRGR